MKTMNFNHAGLRSYEKNLNILIFVYYRHPKRSSNEIFLEKLNQNLHKIKNVNKHVLVSGDFDYDLLRHWQAPYVNEWILEHYVFKFFTTLHNSANKELGKNRPTLIDNIVVSTYDKQLFAGNFLDKVLIIYPIS